MNESADRTMGLRTMVRTADGGIGLAQAHSLRAHTAW